MTEIDNGRHRTIEVDTAASASRWTTITLTNTISGDFIVAGLNPAQRKALADALDPGRPIGSFQVVRHSMAREIDRLTAERDQLQGRVRYLEKMDAAKDERLANLTKNQEQRVYALRESYGERVREANARADAAEAERQYPALNPDDDDLTYPRSAVRSFSRGAFILGAEWANAQHEAEVLRLRRGIEDEIQLTQEAGRTLQVLRLRALLDGPCDE